MEDLKDASNEVGRAASYELKTNRQNLFIFSHVDHDLYNEVRRAADQLVKATKKPTK